VKPLLFRDYVDTGKVRFVYIDFPLPNHPNARAAANASRCAGDQSRYWAFHDLLFTHQAEWQGFEDPTEAYILYARELEFDEDQFGACVDEDRHATEVQTGFDYARAFGVQGTPWFYVNGVRVGGSPDDLQAAIKAALTGRL
jgi:protein-disulfide isomerase